MNKELHKLLVRYAKSIDHQNAEDLVHDAYLKLFDAGKNPDDVEVGYWMMTIRSTFIDNYRKKKNQKTILFEDYGIELEGMPDEKEFKLFNHFKFDYDKLTKEERLTIKGIFGFDVLNEKNKILVTINGTNLLKLSKDSRIPYITLRKKFKSAKIKLKKQVEEFKKSYHDTY